MTQQQLGRSLIIATASFLILVFAATRAHAENFWAGDISVSNLSATPTRGFSDVGHVVLTIANIGDDMDSLSSIEVPSSLASAAGVTRISQTVTRGGGAAATTQPVFLKPRTTKTLGVDDVHLVLFGLKRPLKAGESFPIRMHFARAGTVEAIVWVQDNQMASVDADDAAEDDGYYPRSFACTNGDTLKAEFVTVDEVPTAIIGVGPTKRFLPIQPWDGGEARVTYSDGKATLAWTTGVHLMLMDGSTHLACGGGHHSH